METVGIVLITIIITDILKFVWDSLNNRREEKRRILARHGELKKLLEQFEYYWQLANPAISSSLLLKAILDHIEPNITTYKKELDVVSFQKLETIIQIIPSLRKRMSNDLTKNEILVKYKPSLEKIEELREIFSHLTKIL
jgi:hypothetical protein